MRLSCVLPLLSPLLLLATEPSVAQGCRPAELGYSTSVIATRLIVKDNSAQLPVDKITAAINGAMNRWNGAPCQSTGISYPWFQSQASGAQERIDLSLLPGVSDVIAQNGSTSCSVYDPNNLRILTYTEYNDAQGNVLPCDSVDLGLLIAHELGHYLGLGHTSTSAACNKQLMYPFLDGDESLQAIECQAADQVNETDWERGEVGCTDNDWCDPDHCSPILIDFEGDLFQLSSPRAPVLFDIDGTGDARPIAWTSAGTDDGFLCRDLNGDGRITSGAELFGTATRLDDGTLAPNGYEAMKELDEPAHGGNGDGVLDAKDKAFGELCVWRDANRNAVSERHEIVSVADSGVISLDLTYGELPYLDDHRNLLLFHGGATVLKGEAPTYVRTVDVFFAGSRTAWRE